jgi:hypothetical protein
MHEHVFEEGGATWAAAVATCAQVLMRVVGLVEESIMPAGLHPATTNLLL